jgi:hypothetical protein
MTEIEPWDDPILKLVQDPNLNTDKEKTSMLLNLINQFPLAERKVSKLCLSTFAILQTLEKTNLTFKSWEFMSLDINSDTHFTENSNVKGFTTILADKIVKTCSTLQENIHKISLDLDYITKSSRSLSPIEYISDSGTMLTSLLLKGIKLKNEIVESLTIAYSKAKLILIGQELEFMLDASEDSTLSTYKKFIVSLMKQLNMAIKQEDSQSKYECLAVISDMEKMFESYKKEKEQESALSTLGRNDNFQFDDDQVEDIAVLKEKERKTTTKSDFMDNEIKNMQNETGIPHNLSTIFDEDVPDDDFPDFDDTSSNYTYSSSISHAPMIHSITRPEAGYDQPKRLDSSTSVSTSQLYRTTISDELPYLMTAFSSTKNIAEDVSHYQEEREAETNERESPKKTSNKETNKEKKKKPYYTPRSNLPDISLYSESSMIFQDGIMQQLPSSTYLNSNSLLSKLGIKPQVINTNLTQHELTSSTKVNQLSQPKTLFGSKPLLAIKHEDEGNEEKENQKSLSLLTKNNLSSHTWLNPKIEQADLVD